MLRYSYDGFIVWNKWEYSGLGPFWGILCKYVMELEFLWALTERPIDEGVSETYKEYFPKKIKFIEKYGGIWEFLGGELKKKSIIQPYRYQGGSSKGPVIVRTSRL